jgi:cytochrome P450
MADRAPRLLDAGLASLRSADDAEPWAYYEQLRELGDVVWDDVMGVWLVLSYDLLKQVTREDGEVWGKGRERHYPGVGMTPDEWHEWATFYGPHSLQAVPREEHDAQHRWWMKTFSGRQVRLLGDTLVRPIADMQIDRFAARGRAELHGEFSARVAPRVVAAAMGLPWEDDDWLEHLLELHERRIALFSLNFDGNRGSASDLAAVEAGRAAVLELIELVRPYVEERRAGDGEDFISLVWRAAEDVFGPDHTAEDVIATINVAFSGGSHTTRSTTSSGLYLLLGDPEVQGWIRSGGPSALARFVEETLRLFGAIPYQMRTALRDTELGGVEIRCGERIIGLGQAANRDPRRHPRPFSVDLGRRAPRDHFSFGIPGVSSCPGQGLARTQLTTIFDVVLERLPGLRLDPDREPPRYRESLIRLWKPLHALFE